VNEVVITLDGRDVYIPMETLGITIDMTDRHILAAARASVLESEGIDLNDESGVSAFGVRKALNSNTIYVYPKPVAG
jgi:glycine betaine/choline ABC-type transport system substrate-binding protein